MDRDIYPQLTEWSASPRRKPLILQGARQVGKTHALKWLGKKHYTQVAYCNFERDKKLAKLFEEPSPREILDKLSIYLKLNILPKTTLIILDEIQECSTALNSLKYFQEELNDYPIVAAGSLLGVKLSHHESFPVGKVNFLHLYPLSFPEYLDAAGENRLRTLLHNKKDFTPLNEALHLKGIELLKRYLVHGGMPEAVVEALKAPSRTQTVRDVQMEILKSYELDFVKHTSPQEAIKLSQVWNRVPSQLAKENKKFVFTAIQKSARGRDYLGSIQWLRDAGMIYPTLAVSKPGLPLTSYADASCFKIYLLDVGLLGAMAGLDPAVIAEGTELFSEFHGALTENFVAQQLVSKTGKGELYYWRSEHIAEVDFLCSSGRTVLPLEVKAGVNTKSKSLRVYSEKYGAKRVCRTNLLNFERQGITENYPLYGVWGVGE